MQIKNNYDKDVFSGDIGFIKYIDLDDNTIKVDFDVNLVDYIDAVWKNEEKIEEYIKNQIKEDRI